MWFYEKGVIPENNVNNFIKLTDDIIVRINSIIKVKKTFCNVTDAFIVEITLEDGTVEKLYYTSIADAKEKIKNICDEIGLQ